MYIIPLGDQNFEPAYKLAAELRKQDIAVDIDFLSRKIGKNMDYANSYGVSWVILVGDEEVSENKYALKNMNSGDQEKISVDEIINKIKA